MHNFCTECGEDFGSVEAFDKHRVGEWSTGRECISLNEFSKFGLVKNTRGCWSIEKNLKAVRKLNDHP